MLILYFYEERLKSNIFAYIYREIFFDKYDGTYKRVVFVFLSFFAQSQSNGHRLNNAEKGKGMQMPTYERGGVADWKHLAHDRREYRYR